MRIKKVITKNYLATCEDSTYKKGNFIGGETITYNADSEILESVDNPANSNDGGERHVYTYSPRENGGRVSEHKIIALPDEEIQKETLYKRIIEITDASKRVIEYSEYDIDELVYWQKNLYDDKGNNVESLCEVYEDGEIQCGRVIRSSFDSLGNEVERIMTQTGLYWYMQYKNNGKEIHDSEEIEHYLFSYNEEGELIKEEYKNENGESHVYTYKYDEAHRLLEECAIENDGSATRVVYERDENGNLVSEFTYVNDELSCKESYIFNGADDSPCQTIFTKIERLSNEDEGDGKEIEYYIQEIERSFYQ